MIANKQEIDLKEFKSKDSKVYSGRKRGKKVREALNLDELDNFDVEITFKVPEEIYSINTSFFLGCFGKSVRTLGEKEFKAKYTFDSTPEIKRDIEEGIARAQKEESVI